MPWCEPSRPMPDSLTPPNGATSVEMMPGVDADDAVLQRLGDAPDAADVAAVEVGGEAELGVVGQRDRLVLGREAEQRRDRAERLLARDQHLGGRRRRARSARRTCRRARGARRRSATRRALADARRRCAPRPCRRPPSSISGPCVDAVVEAVADLQRRDRRGELARRTRRRRRPARGGGWRRRRSGRRCGTCEAIAPSTAASRSASSNTMNGALPPSSSETFLIVPAHLRHQHACRPRSSR